MLRLIPLVPLLPFAGFLFCGLIGRRVSKRLVSAVACGSVLGALLVSAGAVWELSGSGARVERDAAGVGEPAEGTGAAGPDAGAGLDATAGARPDATAEAGLDATAEAGEVSGGPRYQVDLWRWLPMGKMQLSPGADAVRLNVPFSLALDPLSGVMILVVTGVGFLIHLYSIGYMAHDPGYARYFSYLNLFTAMMLTLVLGANFLVMFVGWEGVGLCSYLLIGFWYEDEEKARAGRKAFIVNRIGDLAFILGMLAIILTTGTLDVRAAMQAVSEGAMGPAGSLTATAIALALFIGACGKSAQIPLYVWLPDAMAGPTPVSALIHAATMVTAGVYMVSRCSILYLHSPAAMEVVAGVGAATALLAATIGLAQNDIKKVLAYSTISQLGLMFLAAGVGAFAASIFHLVTHAFFKALLFLGSGSVIHAMGGEQDMRRMGGLRARLPVTYWTFLVGAVAIAGIPPLAGFFSKDEILAAAWGAGRLDLWIVGTAVSFCTAFYMFRLVRMTFHGSFRGSAEQEHHLHESPRSMTAPLAILAALSVAGGFLGIPRAIGGAIGVPNFLERWLEPVLGIAAGTGGPIAGVALGPAGAAAGQTVPVIPLALLATAVAVAGIGLAWIFYAEGSGLPDLVAVGAGPIYSLVANRYRVDELYEAIILRPYFGLCAAFEAFDRLFVDGTVNAAASVSNGLGQLARLAQTGFVRGYALMFLFASGALLWYMLR